MRGTEFTKHRGKYELSPRHKTIRNWLFVEGEEDMLALAEAMAMMAEKNGITTTELSHLFPIVLRMLKNKSQWSG